MALERRPIETSNICRVCLAAEEDMCFIFEHKCSAEEVTVASMISECTKYRVQSNDGLPQQICQQCLIALDSAFVFKRKCEKSYKKLLGLLANGKAMQEYMDAHEKGTQTDSNATSACECGAGQLHRKSRDNGSASDCAERTAEFQQVGQTHNSPVHAELEHALNSQYNYVSKKLKHADPQPQSVKQNDDEKSTGELAEATSHLQREHMEEQANMELEDSTHDNDDFDIMEHEQEFENAAAEQNCFDAIAADDKADKSFVNMVNTTSSSGFLAVLLNETTNSESLAVDGEECDGGFKAAAAVEDCGIVAKVRRAVKRKRGRPPKQIHLNNSNEHTQFVCHICKKNFEKKLQLLNHACPELSTSTTLHCEICAENFENMQRLQEHIQNAHERSMVMKCENCDCTFEQETHYRRHLERLHSDKLYKCDRCAKQFTTKIYLQRHLARHEAKRYICKECAQHFETKAELQVHIKAEGHDKPLLCPECGLRCKTNNILMVHMRRHNGEKPFKCKFCGKGFPRMDDLRVHEKYHTGEKSHFCETCGKGFQRKYNLTIHLRVHTGEKPYKCPHCTQAFAQGNDLKSHIRRHTGERFRCEICDAAFLQGYQIRQHKLTEHGIKEAAPTQRVAKFTSPEEQEQQIKQILQKEHL